MLIGNGIIELGDKLKVNKRDNKGIIKRRLSFPGLYNILKSFDFININRAIIQSEYSINMCSTELDTISS